MDFFDQFLSFFEDDNLREQLMAMLMKEDELDGEKMVTGHWSDDGEIVFSVFTFDEWKLLQEMSLIIDKDIEDIIKDLGPDEVQQLYVRPDQGPF
jgi:hypothetical protein